MKINLSRTPRSRIEYEKNKEHFNEYTLQKKRFSIPREVMIIVKPRKNWYEGINIDDLRKKVVKNFKVKGYFKKKNITKHSVYSAVRNLNLYREDIFVISDWGINEKNSKKEYRYFCPYEDADISKRKELFMRDMFRSQLKTEQLEVFEEEIKHEQDIQILKEKERELGLGGGSS